MHVTPGISESILCMIAPRRSNAARIIATSSRPPDTAASAARWATLATFDVAWLWKLLAAFMTSSGPIIQPTRHPVIAYVLATPLTTTHCSARSGTNVGIELNSWGPYVRCS